MPHQQFVLLNRYVHGSNAEADDPLVAFSGSSTALANSQFLYTDRLGSVMFVAGQDGTPIHVNSYDEYGVPGSSNGGIFQYTGQAWIPEAELYHYKARAYSPTLGRFLQPDPIGYGDGMNMYAYVGNSPINGIDPTGTICWTITDEEATNFKTKDDCLKAGAGYTWTDDIVVEGILNSNDPCAQSTANYCTTDIQAIINGLQNSSPSSDNGKFGGMPTQAEKAAIEEANCGTDPLMRKMMSDPEFAPLMADAANAHADTGNEHTFNYGIIYPERGNRFLGFTKKAGGTPDYANAIEPTVGSVIIRWVLIHTHGDGGAGLSYHTANQEWGDIDAARKLKVAIVAFDLKRNTFYCNTTFFEDGM
jgi:RHS repeat-associated protein